MQRTFAVVLFLFLAACSWADSPRWFEVRSAHFTVLTNDSEKDARHIAGQLERMRTVFRSLIPSSNDDGEPPITVFALRDRKSFQSLEPQVYLAKHQLDLAGLFLRGPNGNTILLRLDAEGEHPFATVYHEYTHYMLRKTAVWLPLWLNEGLAEFYQNTDITDKDVHMGQPSGDDILYLRQNRLLPLTTLFAVDHESPYYHDEEKGSAFYAESWALTHYLYINDRQHGTHMVAEYAKNLLKGEDSVTAAQHAFGDLNKLQQTLDQYVSQSNFMELTMQTGASESEASYKGHMLSQADVDADRAAVLIETERRPEALALLEADLQANPKNALAHQAMGELNYREGKLDDAKKWYGEAVELEPESYQANFFFALSCLRTNDHEHDALVEADLKNAIALAPRFADAYDSLANFYAERREHLAEAHQLNIMAVTLEPENIAFRLNAANALAQDQQMASAIVVLKAAKTVAKSPSDIALVDSRIASMEAFEASVKESKATSEATMQSLPASGSSSDAVIEERSGPPEHVYPKGSPTGPMHTISGVIRKVHCNYPAVLVLSLDQGGKMIPLYSNNYFKLEFRTSNYVSKDALEPCHQIEGMKAKVQFAEVSSDDTVVGQVVSIELSK